MKKETLLTALGRDAKKYEGAVNVPTVRTSTVIFPDYDSYIDAWNSKLPYATYGRYGTATRHALEDTLAQVEEADLTLLYPSGVAAISFALLAFLKPGDHLLMIDSVYGPTRKFCHTVLKDMGIETTYYAPSVGADIADLMQENTKVVFTESPGSITFEVQDIPAIAKAAHAKGAIVMGDNTWATPLYANAFALGMDVSIHSLTKYGSGHSDLLMGSVSVRKEHAAALEKSYKLHGLNVSPDDCYLMQRGLRTLATRFEAHEKSGKILAEWFESREETLKILHPAYDSCPGHAFWERDIGRSCGLFSVIVKPYSKDAQRAMFDGMEHFKMGYSWGGYESLIIPLDHDIVRTASPWKEDGLLLRLHAGLENPADLIADLEAGFKRLNDNA